MKRRLPFGPPMSAPASHPGDVYQSGWSAGRHVTRRTVDLSAHPRLVVMYLGMRVQSPRGFLTLLRFGRQVHLATKARPDGLLRSERLLFSPVHVGWRQYWRDLDSLEAWARSPPHREWWRSYLEDTKGTGFWHETYFLEGGMEAIYDGMRRDLGLAAFAPTNPAEGGMFTARHRAERAREAARKGEDGKPQA